MAQDDYHQTEGPPLDAQPPPPMPFQRPDDPYADLRIASKNYWAARTGREDPPAPTYRNVNGTLMLGRYMDPYGCQAHMRNQKILWDKWYPNFLVGIGISLLLGPETDFISLVLIGGVMGFWYLRVKAKHRREYTLYYDVQDEILSSGEPEWVPYDKKRLQLMDKYPEALWP